MVEDWNQLWKLNLLFDASDAVDQTESAMTQAMMIINLGPNSPSPLGKLAIAKL